MTASSTGGRQAPTASITGGRHIGSIPTGSITGGRQLPCFEGGDLVWREGRVDQFQPLIGHGKESARGNIFQDGARHDNLVPEVLGNSYTGLDPFSLSERHSLNLRDWRLNQSRCA